MIETYGYARAGFLGNPSDGYFGKTISFTMSNFRARVLLYPSGRLEIKPSKADLPVFESLDDLYRTTRWRGYYGGIRIIQALIVRLIDYCRENGIELEERNFTLEYESNIPAAARIGGIERYYHGLFTRLAAILRPRHTASQQANLVLETETRELGVPAGLQDRVVQAYQGLVYMDFSRQPDGVPRLRRVRAPGPGPAPQRLCGLSHLSQRRHRGVSRQPAGAVAAQRPRSNGSHDALGELCGSRAATAF